MSPQLVYAVSEDGTEAAFSATMVPTFDAPAAAAQGEEGALEIEEDEMRAADLLSKLISTSENKKMKAR